MNQAQETEAWRCPRRPGARKICCNQIVLLPFGWGFCYVCLPFAMCLLSEHILGCWRDGRMAGPFSRDLGPQRG